MTRILAGTVALLLLPIAARAQSLESKVFAKQDATVRLSYASRPGVCGGQSGNINIRDGDDDEDGWTSDCEEGPVRVVITLRQGAVTRLTTRVGGRWLPMAGVTDLGMVSAPEASQLMLAIARKGGRAADDAIMPAMLADSVQIWPDLLKLAKNPDVNTEVRRSAVFWVGQAAARAATAGLVEVVGDAAVNQDVREAAVFALSQRPHDEGVPALIATARTANDARIRKSAIFWLGQTDDPRALAYFEEVLSKGGASN
jgi:hypothetical protein